MDIDFDELDKAVTSLMEQQSKRAAKKKQSDTAGDSSLQSASASTDAAATTTDPVAAGDSASQTQAAAISGHSNDMAKASASAVNTTTVPEDAAQQGESAIASPDDVVTPATTQSTTTAFVSPEPSSPTQVTTSQPTTQETTTSTPHTASQPADTEQATDEVAEPSPSASDASSDQDSGVADDATETSPAATVTDGSAAVVTDEVADTPSVADNQDDRRDADESAASETAELADDPFALAGDIDTAIETAEAAREERADDVGTTSASVPHDIDQLVALLPQRSEPLSATEQTPESPGDSDVALTRESSHDSAAVLAQLIDGRQAMSQPGTNQVADERAAAPVAPADDLVEAPAIDAAANTTELTDALPVEDTAESAMPDDSVATDQTVERDLAATSDTAVVPMQQEDDTPVIDQPASELDQRMVAVTGRVSGFPSQPDATATQLPVTTEVIESSLSGDEAASSGVLTAVHQQSQDEFDVDEISQPAPHSIGAIPVIGRSEEAPEVAQGPTDDSAPQLVDDAGDEAGETTADETPHRWTPQVETAVPVGDTDSFHDSLSAEQAATAETDAMSTVETDASLASGQPAQPLVVSIAPASSSAAATDHPPVATANFITKRPAGRFMDVVHPSSDMRGTKHTLLQSTRPGVRLQPLASEVPVDDTTETIGVAEDVIDGEVVDTATAEPVTSVIEDGTDAKQPVESGAYSLPGDSTEQAETPESIEVQSFEVPTTPSPITVEHRPRTVIEPLPHMEPSTELSEADNDEVGFATAGSLAEPVQLYQPTTADLQRLDEIEQQDPETPDLPDETIDPPSDGPAADQDEFANYFFPPEPPELPDEPPAPADMPSIPTHQSVGHDPQPLHSATAVNQRDMAESDHMPPPEPIYRAASTQPTVALDHHASKFSWGTLMLIVLFALIGISCGAVAYLYLLK